MARRKATRKIVREEKLAVATARALLAQARAGFTRTGLPTGGVSESAEGIGYGVASSINLLFAIELFLKGVLATFRIGFGDDHDLWRLYTKFPRDVQVALEHAYDERDGPEQRQRLAVSLASRPFRRGDFPSEAPVSGLREVLKRSREAYGKFRYAFEIDEGFEGVQHLVLQYEDLLRVADCLDLMLGQLLVAKANGEKSVDLQIPAP